MGVKSLAEAIILQSLEDLYDCKRKDECKRFFHGDGLKIYGRMAGLVSEDQTELKNVADTVLSRGNGNEAKARLHAA